MNRNERIIIGVLVMSLIMNFIILELIVKSDYRKAASLESLERLADKAQIESDEAEKLRIKEANTQQRVLPGYPCRGVIGIVGEKDPLDFDGLVAMDLADKTIRLEFSSLTGDDKTLNRIKELCAPNRLIKPNLIMGSGRSVFMLHHVSIDLWKFDSKVITGRCLNISLLLGEYNSVQAARKVVTAAAP